MPRQQQPVGRPQGHQDRSLSHWERQPDQPKKWPRQRALLVEHELHCRSRVEIQQERPSPWHGLAESGPRRGTRCSRSKERLRRKDRLR